MTSVSVVILNYNGRQYLEKFLPTVIQHSQKHEIIIADNNSVDGSVEFLKTNFPNIRLITINENYGFCGGYNRAIAQLNSDICVILNSDIQVTENWIEPIIELFEKDEKIAAIQPKLLDFNFRDKFEYAGGAGGFIDAYGYPFCRGRIFETIENDLGQYDDTREIFWASGACMFIRTKLFKLYGGFDEDFFAHMEEIDLCWRMKKCGYKVFYCGESVVYHVGGGTLAYKNPRKTYLNFRNSILVLIKNLSVLSLLWKLPFRWLVDYIAAIKFVLSGDMRDAMMILKAHMYVWRNFTKNFKKRKFIAKTRENRVGIFPKFLLFSYHIAGVRKFSDLKF